MNRIAFIGELTKGYETVIDIGSDHGLVLKYALDHKYIKHAVASDVNQGPLNHAKKNLAGYPVRFYLSDGFKQVQSDFDLALITGMGPHLIIDILNEVKDLEHKTYILGANEKVEVLRKWLSDNGFNIVDEYVIYDTFFYVFLKVEKGQMKLTQEELFIGPKLKHKPERKAYYNHKVKHYKKILTQVKGEKLGQISTELKYFSDNLGV